MTYRPRKQYFADYMWCQTGQWAYYDPGGGGTWNYGTGQFSDPGVGHCYDIRQIWRDVRSPGGVVNSPWHHAPLLWTTKFYALYNHEYTTVPVVGDTPHKNGLFCLSGLDGKPAGLLPPTSIADTSGTMQMPGGVPAGGFAGQYGKAYAINYTGTMHEAAFAFSSGYATLAGPDYTFLEPEDPAVVPPYDPDLPGSQFAPLAISLYGARDIPLTASDGIHCIIVPPGTTLQLFNSAGGLVPIAGGLTGAIVVAVGDISQPYVAGALTYITQFVAYDDLTALDIVRNKEFFIRLMYYPESKPLKRIGVPNKTDPNLDRRLLIYFGSDKKRLKYIGKQALVDYNYTSPANYMFLTTFNTDLNADSYFPTLHQWDEVVCASEWLPFETGEAFVSHTQFPTFAKLGYTKDSSETTYDTASTDDNVVTWLQKEILEIWSTSQNWGIRNKLLNGYDFAVAFPDVWTVATTVGINWRHLLTPWVLPIAPFEDTFEEAYSDKSNDINWTAIGGTTWNTTSTPGWMTSVGVGGQITCDTPLYLGGKDYVIENLINLTGSMNQYFGTNGGAIVNSSILAEFDGATPRIRIQEYTGGAWVVRGTVAIDPAGTHTWIYIRAGALFKIYMDGTLILSATLATVQHSQNEYTVEPIGAGAVVMMDYFNVNWLFFNSYAYIYNTGLTTACQGSIHYHQPVTGIMGYADLTLWEAFSESAVAGEVWLRLHYDNGVSGAAYMGIKIAWDGATKTLTLYDSAGSPHAVAFPTDPEIVNGYVQHSYKLYWAASGGNITQVALYNAADDSLLHLVDGLSLAYGPNMMVEYYKDISNGCETPYLGQIVMWEQPEPTNDFIEVPVFTGMARLIAPVDDKGYYEVLFKAMDYNMYLMSEYDSDTGNHRSEHETTVDDLLETIITENGLTYFRWFQYWNYKTTEVPLGWLPRRMRGFNMHQVFESVAGWAGMRFCSTPEQQFLFTKYYRNFDLDTGDPACDPLEINNPDPQGIYWDSSTVLNYNLSQLGWLTGFLRQDDSQIGRRVGEVVTEAADFVDPLARVPATTDQKVYDTVAAAHVYPTMIARPPVNTAGNVTILDGGNAPDMLNPTTGSDNTQTDAQTTTWLQQEAASFLSTYSHKNEQFILTMYSSYQWYRPMDVIHVEVTPLAPSIQAIDSATILRNNRYVVHSAWHIMHTNECKYTIGRREDYAAGTVVDGYGDVRNKQDKLIRLTQTANEANSNTNQ